MPILSLAGITVVALDETAPILSSPTGTATGQTTATGTVTTDEANGTLYSLVSANATESAATVKASGASQAVTATGVQNVSKTGLTQGTTYYLHYVHTDAAGNDSSRVSSASFTTQTNSVQMVLAGVTVALEAETISSISGSTAGSTITVNTGGVRNLTVNAPTLTYGGIACTSITVTSATSFTAVMPLAGLALGSSNNFVLTVLGVQSAPAARTFNPVLGQFRTFTVPFAQFAPDSWARDDELVGLVEGIVAGDQIDIALKSNATTSTPGGYDVNVDTIGNIYLTDPAGSEGNLAAETELVTVTLALIDASDTYSRSGNMVVDFSLDGPRGTLTLGTPLVSPTVATLPFTWTGTNATGFEYQIDSGAIIAIAASPIGLSGLTPSTAYTYRVRPVNGSWPGTWVSGSFTTSSSSDTTPDSFSFTAQTGVQISTSIISNSAAITGVSSGLDVPVTVANGEWSFSIDSGVTWSNWSSSAGNVRLNYLVRVRRNSSGSYLTAVTVTLTVGGVAGVFSITTRQDDVPPVITLNGSSAITLALGQAWVEPGATANDNVNGTVAVVITGSVNTAVAGAYTLTYTATDAAGNADVLYRVVTVTSGATYPFRRTIDWEGGTTPALVIGDTFRQRITLNSNGSAYDLSTTTAIQACIVSSDHQTQLNTTRAIERDADWSAGLLTINMDADNTAEIAEIITTECFALVEIQVTIEGEKYTWFGAVRLVPGHIA